MTPKKAAAVKKAAKRESGHTVVLTDEEHALMEAYRALEEAQKKADDARDAEDTARADRSEAETALEQAKAEYRRLGGRP